MNKINFDWSKILPHIGIIFSFFVLSFIYFPYVLEGKELKSHDTDTWAFTVKEAKDYNKTHDDVTLWTNSQFGGMPTYQITSPPSRNIMKHLQWLLPLPTPVYILFLYLTGFYILLVCLGCNKWLAAMGALCGSFVSYNFVIIAAGHITKAFVIAFMAPLVGSIWLAFRKNKMAGSLLTMAFLSLAIANNHVQILYYTIFVILFLGIVELVYAFKEKKLNEFFQTVGLLFAAAIIAIGMNATILYTTYEYGKYTMRGDSNELTSKEGTAKPGGLEKDYITAWSYGVDESFTLLIPDFKGGSSAGTLTADSETGKELKSMGVPNVEKMMKDFRLPLYWGTQPGTSGPVYLGAIVCFLFILGFCLVENRTKWWLIPVIVLKLMLSWGRNFMPLTDFFIDYVPLYNKFRTVSMILVATSLCVAIMAVLGLRAFLKEDADKQKNKRALYIAAGISGAICLIFGITSPLGGKNFMPLDYSIIEYISSDKVFTALGILIAISSCIIAIETFGWRTFLKKNVDKLKDIRVFYTVVCILAGTCLIFWIMPSLNENFAGRSDAQFSGNYEFLKRTLPIDRESMLRSDAIRSFIFILLSGALLWFYNEKKRFNIHLLYAGLAVLVLADSWVVSKRYLNESNFQDKKKGVNTAVIPSDADKFILRDKSYHRVLDITVDIFNDAKPGYFHKNIGGYSAVKLSRYQELIEYHLASDITRLLRGLSSARTQQEQDSVFNSATILNMLNMRYLIHDHKSEPIINPAANGNAWLVSSYRIAENADEEMEMLGLIDTRREMVVDRRFAHLLSDISNRDEHATIELISYAPNKLVYKFNSQTDQLAVFSEIFYDKGWNACINGEKAPYFRANYLLRAMSLKAGAYNIEFKFEPQSFLIGKAIATASSAVFIILLIGYMVFRIRKKNQN